MHANDSKLELSARDCLLLAGGSMPWGQVCRATAQNHIWIQDSSASKGSSMATGRTLPGGGKERLEPKSLSARLLPYCGSLIIAYIVISFRLLDCNPPAK